MIESVTVYSEGGSQETPISTQQPKLKPILLELFHDGDVCRLFYSVRLGVIHIVEKIYSLILYRKMLPILVLTYLILDLYYFSG